MKLLFKGHQMSNFYHCAVCEQFLTEDKIIKVQNVLSKSRTWKECPDCGSKVLRVSDENFDPQEMLEFQFHRALS
jgi:DNA-directed RNA polymerase subunit RPC12/RpoP